MKTEKQKLQEKLELLNEELDKLKSNDEQIMTSQLFDKRNSSLYKKFKRENDNDDESASSFYDDVIKSIDLDDFEKHEIGLTLSSELSSYDYSMYKNEDYYLIVDNVYDNMYITNDYYDADYVANQLCDLVTLSEKINSITYDISEIEYKITKINQ
jgi:hypothetical protein